MKAKKKSPRAINKKAASKSKKKTKASKKTVKKAVKKAKPVAKKNAASGKSSAKKSRKDLKVYFRRKSDFYMKNGDPRLIKGGELDDAMNIKIPYRRKSDLARCEKLTDNELIKVVMEQNPEAYKILFKRYEKSLFIYMFHLVRNKDEVEDLLQNVFTKTYKNLHRFDLERKFSSWIYRISHNEAVNFIKRKSKRRLVSWEEITTSKDKLVTSVEADDSAEIFMHKEIAKEMDDALDMLPAKYKKILLLRYFNEYSYQKIGEILDKPVNTVGTLINRAKRKLVEVIQEKKDR